MADNRTSSQKPRRKTGQSANGASAKTKSSSSRSKPASRSKPTARSGSRSRSGGNGASSAKAKAAASSAKDTAKDTASSAKETASSVKKTAAKAAGPAIAIGAAAAGVAGGVLLRGRMRRRKVLGVPLPHSRGGIDAKSIAKAVGNASESFARTSKTLSRDIERAGEQAERIGRILGGEERPDKGGHRSPVEVVLDGLTHRRGGGDG